MDPSSRTRDWLPSVLILRGLWLTQYDSYADPRMYAKHALPSTAIAVNISTLNGRATATVWAGKLSLSKSEHRGLPACTVGMLLVC